MIDTNKAREIAQRLKEGEQPIINLSKLLGVKLPDGTLLPEAAALLLALADEHDRMAKDAARYRYYRNLTLCEWTHPIVVKQVRHDSGIRYEGPVHGQELDALTDAAMGADNG